MDLERWGAGVPGQSHTNAAKPRLLVNFTYSHGSAVGEVPKRVVLAFQRRKNTLGIYSKIVTV